MLQFTKDNTITLTYTNGQPVSNGSVVKAKVSPKSGADATANFDVLWTTNDFVNSDPSMFIELPSSMFSSIVCFNTDGSQVFTFATPPSNNSPVIVINYLAEEVMRQHIYDVLPEFDGKITITGYPMV